DELASRLLGLVDGQRVVGDELGEGGGDLLEQRVQLLLGEELVEDIGEALVRLDAPGARRRRRDGPQGAQLPRGVGHAAYERSRCAACYDTPDRGLSRRSRDCLREPRPGSDPGRGCGRRGSKRRSVTRARRRTAW